MNYFLAALLAVGLVVMGFIGGAWYALRRFKHIEVKLPDDASDEDMQRIAQDLVDRMNNLNKRDE